MELEITPEPSEDERSAIVEALKLELKSSDEPSAWRRLALQPPAEEDDLEGLTKRRSTTNQAES